MNTLWEKRSKAKSRGRKGKLGNENVKQGVRTQLLSKCPKMGKENKIPTKLNKKENQLRNFPFKYYLMTLPR